MNLIPAIQEMEATLNELECYYKTKSSELKEGLSALRKLNTVCEQCRGEGKVLRPRACAEDDIPNPDDPTDYNKCIHCGGTGAVNLTTIGGDYTSISI